MSWKPTTDFEEEIVASQPDHDFIFTDNVETEPTPFYPRPQAHLDYAASRKHRTSNNKCTNARKQTLDLIAKVQTIAGTKPLGELPSVDDWDDRTTAERESIALMRGLGIGPSIEEPLNSSCTIATFPITKKIHVARSGSKRLPIIFDDDFFKLQPRSSTSNSCDDLKLPTFEDCRKPLYYFESQEIIKNEKGSHKTLEQNVTNTGNEPPNSASSEFSLDNSFGSNIENGNVEYKQLLSKDQIRNKDNAKAFYTAKELYNLKRRKDTNTAIF